MPSLRSILFRLVRGMDEVVSHLPSIGRFQPLKGSFSAITELQEGRLNGKVVAECQRPGPIPEGSITQSSRLKQHDHQPWPVFWTRSDDARLVGRIRTWRDSRNSYCIEGNYYLKGRRRLSEDRLFAQILPAKPTKLHGAWTSIASNWGDGRNYFHWITDNLTRLRLREELPEPTRVLLPVSNAPYIRETLELLGIDADCEMPAAANLAPERYYFCSPLAMSGVWNPLGFDWLRERFRPHFRETRNGTPVFLTRRGSSRIPEQLAAIEGLFGNAGFTIVDCGKLTVREQIAAMSSAPMIAGLHGAAMTNVLWAPAGTSVLELFQPAYLNACYEQIAFQGRLDYSAIVLEGDRPIRRIEEWLAR